MKLLTQIFNKNFDHYGISQKRDFLCVLVVFGLFSSVFAFVSTFLNLKIQNLHVFPDSWMAFVLALPYVGSFFGTLFFPYFSKKFSLKRMLLLTFLVLDLGYLSIFLLLKTSISGFLLFLFGLLHRWVFLILYVYQGKIFLGAYQARLFSFAGLLYGVCVAFGSYEISFLSFEKGLWFSIFLIVSCFFISSKLKKDQIKKPKASLEKSLEQELSAQDIIKQNALFFLIVFVGYVTFYGFSTYYPFFGEGLGLSEAESGSFLAFAQFFGLFLIPVGGYLGDKFGHEKSVFFMILLILSVLGFAFLTENISLLSFFFALAEGAMVSFYTMTIAWIAFLYPTSNLVKGIAFLNLAAQAGSILSPLGMGIMMQLFGNKGFIAWLFIGTSTILGLLVIRMIFHTTSSKS
ncbi:MAG: MFS transporter [Proteobacteria bacterium]|nr:MFS transporter [Pseudomonadota bacterium]